jgi:hypothetical protein
MKAARRTPRLLAGDLPAVGELMRELTLPDDAADLWALADLCRRSLRVRSWLFGRFAKEPALSQLPPQVAPTAAFPRWRSSP